MRVGGWEQAPKPCHSLAVGQVLSENWSSLLQNILQNTLEEDKDIM